MRAETRLSWGRHPAIPQTRRALHWRSEIGPALQTAEPGTLGWGNGRSYGDSGLAAGGRLLNLRALDRFLAFDRDSGVVRAEAGMTLAELTTVTLPAGWFVPVTPGTAEVTLGGAVANDVHGKNHHCRGSFGRHVRCFALQRSDRAPLVCSNEAEPELFGATIGGLGLTGIIEWVELQLMPVGSTLIDTVSERFDSLDGFFELSDALDPHYEYAVSWVDVLARGDRRGRGIYTAGRHVDVSPGEPPGEHVDKPFAERAGSSAATRSLKPVPPRRAGPDLPFCPPFSLVQPWTVRAFNAACFQRAPATRRSARVDYRPFFYPLDRIGHWNRLYGPRGFQQFQCVIPMREARDGIAALLDAIAATGQGSFLAVLKRCGDLPSPGWLSFPMAGTSLALDFAQQPALERDLLPRLDAIVDAAGGRLYPAKDAHMSAAHFQRAYPAWQKLEALRDPALLSHFWQRVTGLGTHVSPAGRSPSRHQPTSPAISDPALPRT